MESSSDGGAFESLRTPLEVWISSERTSSPCFFMIDLGNVRVSEDLEHGSWMLKRLTGESISVDVERNDENNVSTSHFKSPEKFQCPKTSHNLKFLSFVIDLDELIDLTDARSDPNLGTIILKACKNHRLEVIVLRSTQNPLKEKSSYDSLCPVFSTNLSIVQDDLLSNTEMKKQFIRLSSVCVRLSRHQG